MGRKLLNYKRIDKNITRIVTLLCSHMQVKKQRSASSAANQGFVDIQRSRNARYLVDSIKVVAPCHVWISFNQARNQGGESPLQNFSSPLEKCVGHSLKLLDII